MSLTIIHNESFLPAAIQIDSSDEHHPTSSKETGCSATTQTIILGALVTLCVILIIVLAIILIGPSSQSSTLSVPESLFIDFNATPAACTNRPLPIEEGPFFVDEKILLANLSTTSTGVPITLTFPVYNSSDTQCIPIVGALVDLWEADYSGKYSDEQSEGTKGQKYLRGYQLTDKSGVVSFTTIWPGWYNGRTTHLHAMVRTLGASGNVLYRGTTQLYFDDTLTDQVYKVAPYNRRTARTTRNSNDRIYNIKNQLPIIGSVAQGFIATYTLGIPFSS